MDDCWVGMPADRYEAYGDRIGFMHTTSRCTPERLRGIDSAATRSPSRCPGANGRGPMNQLRPVLRDAARSRARSTACASSRRPRSPRSRRAIAPTCSTRRYGVVLDWGLGLVVDWYATGRYSSRRAFGHGGHQSSVAFCDPEHDLVVAVVCNGMPGRERHSARLDAISSAIYVDVGIAAAGDPGRSKPFPVLGL